MSTMSKNVRIRLANSQVVRASLKVHGPEIAPGLRAQFPSTGEPPLPEPALKQLLEALDTLMEDADQGLDKSESAYVAEQADDQAPREARDLTIKDTRDLTIRCKAALEAGGADLSVYGLDKPIPTVGPELASYALSAGRLLEQANARLDVLGTEIRTSALGHSLCISAEALSAALAKVTLETRELQLAQERRDAALATWTRTYQGVAQILSALFKMAGREALADRVRPTERRTQGLESAEETETPETPSPSTPPKA